MKKEFGKLYVTTNDTGASWIVLCTKEQTTISCFEGVVIYAEGMHKVGYTSDAWLSDLFHPVHSAEFKASWAPTTPSVSVTSYF